MTARRLRTVAVLGLAATLVAGCAPAQSAVSPDVSSRLATSAQQLRTDAASGRYGEGMAQLDSLEREAKAASGSGKISAERSSQILDAIAAVRSDLQTLESAARPAPAPTAEPTPTEDLTPTPAPEPTKGKGRAKKP
ncbi:hypothetical protein SCMU_01040 [Sinomonas cyclohexanicum]|uniref:Uncharacterized protein n=1 Tax=Sinomonas cyclohexanicum TaxID=322009 RepID=A0ABM7PQ20_SINCY|nr:hypothetical protein [Corynebacterium cyclohexanicum]BCT74262.1 hypothetical protein SCMU_01040 [Corynebacterium cyclohexanicum]